MECPTVASFHQTPSSFHQTPPEASSSSSNAASRRGDNGYDVFINHRGPDTKKTFAGHLYSRLHSKGFSVFLDQPELRKGLGIYSQIQAAILSASVHVAIFSPAYAESHWCLDELLLMLDSNARVIPVYYHVNPTDLKRTQNKMGVYGEALNNMEKMKKTYDPQTGEMTAPRYDVATIQNWRNALSRAAELSGFVLDGEFNGDESHMLDKVVEEVERILDAKMDKKIPLQVAKYATGLDKKLKDIETIVLKQQEHSGKVQVVGIVGLGGVGKTTLALEIFNRSSPNYKKSFFFADIRENAKNCSLHSLQGKVLKGLTQLDINLDHTYEGTPQLKRRLLSFHVLLVLDDVDHVAQLEALLPIKDVLRSDSLILITSRDRNVLKNSGVEASSIYKLTGLTPQHSRELFCSFAFSQAFPLQGFEILVDKFLRACDGLPLSLRVFGALLCGNTDKSVWEARLSQVQVPNDIEERLKISYESLDEEEKQIFLDVACFFSGENRDITIGIWDQSGWEGLLGFQTLESKCLVEVDSDNYIFMHQHLRDLGRRIALEKSPRRLTHPRENIDDLLQQSSVTSEVRGIRTFPNSDRDTHKETLSWYQRRSRELFGNHFMKHRIRLHNTRYRSLGIGFKNLRLLETEGHHLERILRRAHFPNLIWLSWRHCPYSYLPSWIPMKKLMVLKLEGRKLKTLWQDRLQAPVKLRELEVSGFLPNISKFIGQLKHLERIVFDYGDLQKLPDEVYHLTSLKALVLRFCSKLKALPDSFDDLRNLQHIELSECGSLERLPDSFCHLRNLQRIKLSGCSRLEKLPDSFGDLRNLQHIELYGCWRLQKLPDSFGNLRNLQHIKLTGCWRLETLPDSFGYMRNLQHIQLSECDKLMRLPYSFGKLTNLQHIELSECRRLDSLSNSFGDLKNLQHIYLYCCENLQRLPESLCNLTNLQHIELSACRSLERLPDSFGNMTNLQHIELSECLRLEELPDSLSNMTNLQCIKFSECRRLKRLPDSFGNMTNLQHIELSECRRLEGLPDSFGNLTNLQHIKLSACRSLVRLPDSFGNLTNIQHFELSGCRRLEKLPDSFGNSRNLQHIQLSGCESLQKLPDSFGNLRNLQHIELSGCGSLQKLPDSFGNFKNLRHIDVSDCKNLQELPSTETMGYLEQLKVLHCVNLKSIPNLTQLTKLKLLDVHGCLVLEELNGVEHCISLEKLRASSCPSLNWDEGVLNRLRQQETDIIL